MATTRVPASNATPEDYLTDPTPRRTDYVGRRAGRIESPWGSVDIAIHHAPDCDFCNTPSHGGFRVANGLLERVESVHGAGFKPWAGRGWYEEDCDWAAVVAALPELFSRKECFTALRCVARNAVRDADEHNGQGWRAILAWSRSSDCHAAILRAKAEHWARESADLWECTSGGTKSGYDAADVDWVSSFRRFGDDATLRAVPLAGYFDHEPYGVWTLQEILAAERTPRRVDYKPVIEQVHAIGAQCDPGALLAKLLGEQTPTAA